MVYVCNTVNLYTTKMNLKDTMLSEKSKPQRLYDNILRVEEKIIWYLGLYTYTIKPKKVGRMET